MATRSGLRWNCWPEAGDDLLLRAILHRDDTIARAAWHEAQQVLDLDDATHDEQRLFGLLARRLTTLAPDDPRLPQLKAAARHTTFENLVHLTAIDAVMDLLAEAGIEAVVLKGAALLLSVYDNTSLRPIADVDLFLRPDRLADAVALFASAGWIADPRDHLGNHAIGMDGGPISVDLHRALNQELVAAGVSDNGWGMFRVVEAPKPLPSGRRVSILESTDALLHTIAHGLQWNGPIPLRWVPDSAQLLAHGAIDGDRLCHLAEVFAMAPVVHDALVYADEVVGGIVDPAVLRTLDAMRPSRLDELRLRAFHERPAAPGEPPPMGFSVSRYLQRTTGDTILQAIGHVPEFLMQQFDATGWFDLGRRLTGEGLMRVGQALGGTSSRRRGGSDSI